MGKTKAGKDSPIGDWVLEEMLKVAIEDEKTDREKYRRLARMAERERDGKMLYTLADENRQHEKALQFIFAALYGKEAPKPEIVLSRAAGFGETVRKAIAIEYEGASFYREILARLSAAEFKTVIRRLMADKQRHAQILEMMLEKKV